ncbi:MAG: protease inhibitor I42 family protein [Cytophaga sp.]|uniref:protease inhibitor I42 family protein n=1 Tax=Cytophaga sp. TaxID=29535 RepID=UPI003F7D4DE5
MKKIYLALISFIVLVTVVGIIYYRHFRYVNTTNDTFDCKVGETFKIRLYENGSTGYVNCWLNECQCKLVQQVKTDFIPSIYSRLGYDGAGGVKVLTFKAVSPGHGTIKFASCFIGGNEECEDFTPENTPPDNEFIIDVRK